MIIFITLDPIYQALWIRLIFLIFKMKSGISNIELLPPVPELAMGLISSLGELFFLLLALVVELFNQPEKQSRRQFIVY